MKNEKPLVCYDDEQIVMKIVNGRTEINGMSIEVIGTDKIDTMTDRFSKPILPNENATIIFPDKMKKYGTIQKVSIHPVVGMDICMWGLWEENPERC